MRIAKAVSVKAARAGKTYGKKPERFCMDWHWLYVQ